MLLASTSDYGPAPPCWSFSFFAPPQLQRPESEQLRQAPRCGARTCSGKPCRSPEGASVLEQDDGCPHPASQVKAAWQKTAALA
jgi:hypothetical protein